MHEIIEVDQCVTHAEIQLIWLFAVLQAATNKKKEQEEEEKEIQSSLGIAG